MTIVKTNHRIICDLQILEERQQIVNHSGHEIQLRRREFQLFNFLLNNMNLVVHKETLLELVWDFTDFTASNTLEVHLSSLRKKLRSITDRVIIQTVHGIGYRLVTQSMETAKAFADT